MKAESHVLKGEVDAARKLYHAILKKFPKNESAASGLAALSGAQLSKGGGDPRLILHLERLAQQLKHDDAAPVAKEAAALLKEYDSNEFVWNVYGNANMRLGQYSEAERAFKKAIEIAPNFGKALSSLARICEVRSELDAAVAYYRRALSAVPNSSDLIVGMGMGRTLIRQGKLSVAQTCFEQVLSHNPDHILALNALAGLHSLRGNFADAIVFYERVMMISPIDIERIRLFSAIPVGKLPSDLVQKLQRALDCSRVTDANRSEWMFAQGNLHRHKGDMEKALDSYCVGNVEKGKNLQEEIIFRETERKGQLKRIRHWTPKPTSKTAEIQTLIILGPSRSGKTTLERMLQHSVHVASNYEAWKGRGKLTQIAGMALAQGSIANSPPYREQSLAEPLTIEDLFYRNEAALTANGKRVLTTTSPAFINYVAHLTDLLPGVFFCYIKRPPAEIAGQIFATNYKRGNIHSYDPTVLLAYLKWYEEMWDAMSGKVRGIALNFEDIMRYPQHAVGLIEKMLGQDLQIRDLTAAGFSTVDPFAEVFARRFMTQSR